MNHFPINMVSVTIRCLCVLQIAVAMTFTHLMRHVHNNDFVDSMRKVLTGSIVVASVLFLVERGRLLSASVQLFQMLYIHNHINMHVFADGDFTQQTADVALMSTLFVGIMKTIAACMIATSLADMSWNSHLLNALTICSFVVYPTFLTVEHLVLLHPNAT